MDRKKIDRRFWGYVIPSAFSFLLSGIYYIIDGFFVGRAIGDIGLSGINIGWPISALIFSVGTGLGVGGSVMMSTYKGQNNINGRNKAKGNTLTLLFLSSLIMTVILLIFSDELLMIFGAKGELLGYASDYILPIILGSLFQVFGSGLIPILRNDGKVVCAMVSMILGFLTNVILDAIFVVVLKTGIQGSAYATVISQAVTMLPCIIALFGKELRIGLNDFLLDFSKCRRIIRIGLSPFGLSYAPAIVILFADWQSLKYGNENAVATYAVLSYLVEAVQLLFQGIGDGVQPLISYYSGAEKKDLVGYLRKKAFILAVAIGIISAMAFIMLRGLIPRVFGASVQTAEMLNTALVIAGLSLPMIAFSRVSSSYFYAIEKTKEATVMVYSESLFISPMLLMILPLCFNLEGVWLTIPFAQGILVMMAIVFFLRFRKKEKK